MPDFIIPSANPDVVELPRAFNGVPEQLHPDQINYADFNDNPALKRASDALKRGWDEGAAINEFRANPHDEDRAATHDRKVRERADAVQHAFNEAIRDAEAGLKEEHRRVVSALDDKAGLKPNPTHFNAITSAFYSMKAGERVRLVGELIEQGDHASLATLIEAPLFLTGLPAEVRDGIKTRVLTKVDPQGLKLRDQLATALERSIAGHARSLAMFDKLRAGTEPGAWKERAKQAAIQSARANIAARG